jgi:hypothetical protein
MSLRHITNLKAPIGEIIDGASADGVLIDTNGQATYALMPLDDELLDYLVERNPKFIRECQEIRGRMRQGAFHSHDDVRRIVKG